MDLDTAGKGPVLPGGLFEDDEDVVGARSGFVDVLYEVGEDLLFYFYASSDGEEDLDDDEVLGSGDVEVGVAWIVHEVFLFHFEEAMEFVAYGDAAVDEGGVDGVGQRFFLFTGPSF